jgi:hypothetical protein
VPANAGYRRQLIDRAVDLVQLFTTSGTKNGADIRLSIDAVDDLLHDPAVSHIVIVGGDSDYIALAQRCKRMGRFVVGIGVTGSISRALVAACDEFSDYADLPSVPVPVKKVAKKAAGKPVKEAASKKTAATKTTTTKKATAKKPAKQAEPVSARDQQATSLLLRAIRVGLEKNDDEWLHSSSVKSQMQRMDSTFKEKSLGFSSFRAFVESRSDLVQTKVQDNGQLTVRLK